MGIGRSKMARGVVQNWAEAVQIDGYAVHVFSPGDKPVSLGGMGVFGDKLVSYGGIEVLGDKLGNAV